MTHLATVFFLQGREDACRSVAAEALETIERRLAWRPRFAAHRAQLVLQLANLSGLPWAKASDERPHDRQLRAHGRSDPGLLDPHA